MTYGPNVDQLREMFLGSSFGPFRIEEIRTAYQPHAYVITGNHVSHAADHFSGILHDQSIEDAEKRNKARCGHPDCEVLYKDHDHTHVIVLEAEEFNMGEWITTLAFFTQMGEAWGHMGIGFGPNLLELLKENEVLT